MSCVDDVDSAISRLVAAKEQEQELLTELDTLLQTVDLPEHVRRVVTHAREVLDEDAISWLATPHWSLDHRRPLQVAQSAEGSQRVEDLLIRIAIGLPV